MKIIFWGPYIGKVGTIKAQINSAASLKIYGNHATYLIKAHSEWEGYEPSIADYGIEIIDFKLNKIFKNLNNTKILGSRLYMITVAIFSYFKLKRLFNEKAADVLITNLIAIPAIIAANRSKNKPVIISSIQGFPKFLGVADKKNYKLWMKIEDRIRKFLWNIIYTKADHIVCMTESTREKIIKKTKISAEKISVIENPIVDDIIFKKSEEPLEHSWFIEKPYPIVIGIGRLTQQKDFNTLIRAFDKVNKKMKARLIILGEGEERERLENLIKDSGLMDSVQLLGHVDNPFSYLKNSDVFVLSSLWEDPGHAILEAAALSVPIVTTNCPSGPADLIEQGKGGELCDVGDVEGMASSIMRILESENYTKSQIAYQNAMKFTLKSHYDQLSKLIDQGIQKNEN